MRITGEGARLHERYGGGGNMRPQRCPRAWQIFDMDDGASVTHEAAFDWELSQTAGHGSGFPKGMGAQRGGRRGVSHSALTHPALTRALTQLC